MLANDHLIARPATAADDSHTPMPSPRRHRAQSRWLVVTFIGNILAIGIDWIALADGFRIALALRLLLLMPLMLVALCLHRWSSNRWLRAVATCTATITFIALVAALGQFASETFASRYMMIAIFMLFAAILFAGLPLYTTWIMYGISTAVYAVIVATSLKMTIVYLNLDLIFVCAAACGLALMLRKRQDSQMAEIFRMRKIDIARSSELHAANERLAVLSTIDSLTGVFNRRQLDIMADRFARWPAPGCNYSVLMIDVDHFKKLNDHLGHSAGDRCLRLVAVALQDGLRSDDDSVVRYGGEEFAVLLWHADLDEGVAVGERLRRAIADLRIPHPGLGPDAYVSVSIGVHSAPRSENLMTTLTIADEALYLAKQAGRNRVTVVPTPADTRPDVSCDLLAVG